MFDAMKVLDWEAVCSAALSGLGHALLLGSVLAVLTWIVVRVLHKRIFAGAGDGAVVCRAAPVRDSRGTGMVGIARKPVYGGCARPDARRG
jgi:hypothetical protein